MPRISVLIPCFNHGAWIDEAVDSVLAQTCQDFEVVIVDDGSTDPATRDKLSNYERPKTRVVRTENRGLPAARNTAARETTGEFCCALDADDRLAPAWFEKATAVLDRRPEIAFVSHWLQTFGDEKWTWTPRDCLLPSMLTRNAVNGAALVRRTAFNALGGYDEGMRDGCEDWDFWLRLIEQGFPGAIIPEVLFYYRRTAASMSRGMTDARAYRAPLEVLIRKHGAAYRAHAVEVLVAKSAESLALARELDSLERDHLTKVLPALSRAREELAAADRSASRARAVVAARQEHERLAAERQQLAAEREQLAAERQQLASEVADLRSSLSWRITAPLRAVYGWLRGAPR